jgi:hypothetical protein
MIAMLFTQDFNTYQLSNDLDDNVDRYIAEKNALYIITKHAQHPLFSMSDAIVIIPYQVVVNVLYRDATGKTLADYVLYRKGLGKPCAPPLEPPMTAGEYSIIQRYLSLVGDHIPNESSLE